MNIQGKLESIANIATIGVAALLSVVLVKVYLLKEPVPSGPPGPREAAVGTSLSGKVPGVDWRGNGRTLVLAISSQCHFCKESTPFYRKVANQLGGGLKTVAILPQPVGEAEEFLSGEGVHVDQVRQVNMGDVGVQGTPTMLLVNSRGVVTKVWVGKVKPEDEQQVMAALQKG